MAVTRRVVFSILTAALALLAACGDDGGTPSSCLPECPASRGYDATAYHLSARFDWATSTLHAVEDLTLAGLESPIIELDAEVVVISVHAGSQRLAFANDPDAGTLHVDVGPIVGDAAPVTFTVEYTAALSDALRIGGPRDDDPITARVLYTDSEPDRGLRWLVAKHDPSDRAHWSVDLTVPSDHDVVANGRRADDQLVGGERLISYTLDQDLPTYLMAFATGELDHVERTTGRVPLAVWFRRGLVLDPDAQLDVVADAMATFDALIGPYPWDRYAVVLLPGFGGGMENATITFNDEASGQGAVSFGLNAHELAHQWFGDWVTMRDYDDVWVKEGMATFLAAEATRARRDRAQVGRFFGRDFSFFAGDAIVDPELTGLSKYTSGPYERAAWLITQVRAVVGEDAFWAGLRRVQTEHAVGDIDGAEFLRSFGLPAPILERALASLPRFGAPRITATTGTAGGGVTTFTIRLFDSEQLLIAPIELVVVDDTGRPEPATLSDVTAVVPVVPPGSYLAPDPRGIHPPWTTLLDDNDTSFPDMLGLFTPTAAPARTDFLQRSPSHQELAMSNRAPLPVAAEVAAFYDGLDSVSAQRSAVSAACVQLRTLTSPEAEVLHAALVPLLRTPPVTSFSYQPACAPALSQDALGTELAAAVIAPTATTAARLDYLLGFDYGPAMSLALIGEVATTAPSLRLRDLALGRLVNQTNDNTSYTPIPDDERPAWRQFFRARLALTTSSRRLGTVWGAAVNLDDVDALPIVAPLLHSVPMSEYQQTQTVCFANFVAAQRAGAWESFQAATMPWSTLSAGAAAALADPSSCFQKATAPSIADDEAPHDHVRHLRDH